MPTCEASALCGILGLAITPTQGKSEHFIEECSGEVTPRGLLTEIARRGDCDERHNSTIARTCSNAVAEAADTANQQANAATDPQQLKHGSPRRTRSRVNDAEGFTACSLLRTSTYRPPTIVSLRQPRSDEFV